MIYSKIKLFLYSKPSGYPSSVIMFSSAFVFLIMYLYYGLLQNTFLHFQFFLATSFIFIGIAESLSDEQINVIYLFRIIGISIPIIIFISSLTVPQIILHYGIT